MSTNDIIALIALIASTVTAILMVFVGITSKNISKISNEISKRMLDISEKMAETQTKLMHAQTEMQMRSMIFESRQAFQKAKIEKSSKELVKFYTEQLARMYDEVCGQYMNGKMDKLYFETTYLGEVEEFVNSGDAKKLYDGQFTEYSNTLKVHKERFIKQPN